jgi:hypothetical protein
MDLSVQILILLGILLIALFITYFVIDKVRPEALQSVTPKYGSLNKPISVGTINDVRDNFLTPSGATFITYLFLGSVGKTLSISPSDNPLTIFTMGSALQLVLLPGGVSMPPKTVLKVMTNNPSVTSSYYEEIILPDFPQQSWVHFALVREGRRYTVFYNGEAVSSHRTDYFPVVTPAKLTIGNNRLRGEFALPKFSNVPLTQDEIKIDLTSSSDTKHEPYKPFNYSLSFANFGCPNGIFCFTAKGNPSTFPQQTWNTAYA